MIKNKLDPKFILFGNHIIILVSKGIKLMRPGEIIAFNSYLLKKMLINFPCYPPIFRETLKIIKNFITYDVLILIKANKLKYVRESLTFIVKGSV